MRRRAGRAGRPGYLWLGGLGRVSTGEGETQRVAVEEAWRRGGSAAGREERVASTGAGGGGQAAGCCSRWCVPCRSRAELDEKLRPGEKRARARCCSWCAPRVKDRSQETAGPERKAQGTRHRAQRRKDGGRKERAGRRCGGGDPSRSTVPLAKLGSREQACGGAAVRREACGVRRALCACYLWAMVCVVCGKVRGGKVRGCVGACQTGVVTASKTWPVRGRCLRTVLRCSVADSCQAVRSSRPRNTVAAVCTRERSQRPPTEGRVPKHGTPRPCPGRAVAEMRRVDMASVCLVLRCGCVVRPDLASSVELGLAGRLDVKNWALRCDCNATATQRGILRLLPSSSAGMMSPCSYVPYWSVLSTHDMHTKSQLQPHTPTALSAPDSRSLPLPPSTHSQH